jgi:hypothetical protein
MNQFEWDQFMGTSKKNRITYLKTSKPNPAVETVLVVRNFGLNGVVYQKGDEIEMRGHDLFRAKKRGNVKSIGEDPFIKTGKCVVLKRFSCKGSVVLPGDVVELSGADLAACLNAGKVRLLNPEIDEQVILASSDNV